jgi:hypothetical protein
MGALNIIEFDIILDQLNETNKWLNDIKINTDKTRFTEIIEHVKLICEHRKKNNLQDLVDKYDNEILWYALLESGAFIDIYESFKNLKSHQIPRAKLSEILNGPFLPKDEDTQVQNTHSRNTLFELQIAAKFSNADIKIIGFDDFDFVLDEHKFNAQCKRIHSIKRIQENVEKAYEQIKQKLKDDEANKAIICISIDKLTEKDGKILKVKREENIAPEMIKITSDFIESYKKYWQNFIDTRLIATLVYFQAAAIIEDTNLLTRCYQIEIDPIAIPKNQQSKEYGLILNMVQKLQGALK